MKTILAIILILIAPSLLAQQWQKVATENSGNMVALPAGVTYRFGSAAQWCDPVTTTKPTIVQIHHAYAGCTIKGVARARFTEKVKEELDVQNQAKPFQIETSTEHGEELFTVPAKSSKAQPLAKKGYAGAKR